MNKRIKKKRAQMSPLYIGNNVYTREEIKIIVMNNLLRHWLIPRIYFASLDPNKSGVHVWRKKNMKRALKYMYKHRKEYLTYQHLRFARHLKTIDEFIPGGEHIEYASSAFIPIKETMNSCEAASMEVD